MPSVREFLGDYFSHAGNPDMATVSLKEIEAATGLQLTREDLKQAVVEYQPYYYLVVRGPDEFSEGIYIWICSKPPDTTITRAPERCWIIRHADSDATRNIAEGLLVFSRSGYAIGFMAAVGFGDFNVEAWTWQDLAEKAKREHAVLDYVEGRAKNIIPFQARSVR